MNLKNKNCLIFGLGKSGKSSLLFLQNAGAFCYVFDDNKNNLVKYENKRDVNVVYEITDDVIRLMDYVVLSPGISIFDERVKLAKLYGVKVLGELELGMSWLRGKVIGITGTNGKTTTSSIIYHILKTAGKSSVLCGNIGEPITENILPHKSNYVVEMSSFQLESANQIKTDIAIITNITANHIDRHLNFENYVEAKFNIFKNMKKSGHLILNYDDKTLQNLNPKGIKPKVEFVSAFKEIDGFFCRKQAIYYKKHNKIKKICDISGIKLQGKHNIQNILFAVAVAKKMKIKNQVIEQALISFQPLKHRLQFVKNVDGVDFVNDSKSTSVDSSITAIDAYSERPTVLILGGSDKNTSFEYLAKKIASTKSIKCVVISGVTTQKIVKSLKKYKYKNYCVAQNFEEAVYLAKQNAKQGYVVLLSPACASFDEFSCYEKRGEKFIELVNKF